MRGAPFVLGVVFVVLKLTGYITWSWLWVTCPFWIGFALFIAFGILGAVVVGGVTAVVRRRL